ncbi:MAG: hypothetical protein Q7S48_02725 [bacterium]|nr:hypothetical protein [bacterium]
MSKQLSDQEIDKILFKLRDRLDFKEHGNVKEMLKRAREGGLYREELHKELLRLRAHFKISSGDTEAIENAVFGE